MLKAAIAACLKASDFDCTKGTHGPIGSWDVSAVTDMSNHLPGAEKFDADLSKWDVSRVTTMYEMFLGASSFNGDLSKWDVSRVTGMSHTFASAPSFNGDVSKWDVSRVTNMWGIFTSASSFNGDLSKWDVSRVISMEKIFCMASSFAQTLCGAWRTSTAKKDEMFDGSSAQMCPSGMATSASSVNSLIAPRKVLDLDSVAPRNL